MRPVLRILFAAALPACANLRAQDAGPDFAREVRPILSQHCFTCHGPDETSRKGGLRLDARDPAIRPLKSGRTAIVPGDAERSELVRRIRALGDDAMPPAEANRQLTDAARDTLVRWIAAGAEYRAHWAFVPPTEPPLPAVRDPQWPRQPFDTFVLARLEREGLRPQPEADRWTLVRRVYLDLVGMPPTADEAQAFVADAAPDAYERLVDRLLAMPQYGERWARRWLDLARYADTNGYEKDRGRTIWPWRDEVIRALNADQPFDRFTIEQLAGDMLPDATPDQIVASGFQRNTMLNEEGGIDPLEFRFHALTDRVATTGTAWLGLTVGCAQCHTHKFDPIPQREYYALMACLDDADELDYTLPDAAAAADEAAAHERARALLAELPEQFPLEPAAWIVPAAATATATSGAPEHLADGSFRFAAPAGPAETYTLAFATDLPRVSALRLEVLCDDALPRRGPGHAPNGNFVLSELRVTAGAAPVAVAFARADAEQRGFPVAAAIDADPNRGWAVDVGGSGLNRDHVAVFEFAEPVENPGGTRFTVQLVQRYGGGHTIGRLRLAVGAIADSSPAAHRAACERAFAAHCAKETARATAWTVLRPTRATSNLPRLEVEADGAVFASGDITKSDTYELALPAPPRGTTALRLEVLPDDRLPAGGPGMAYYEGPRGDFFLGEVEAFAAGAPLAFARASESYGNNAFGGAATAALAIDGDPQTGWSTAGRAGERHVAVFALREPLGEVRDLVVRLHFGRHFACSLGRFRLAATTRVGGAEATDLPADVEQALAGGEPATAAPCGPAFEHFLRTAPELASARGPLRDLAAERPRVTTPVFRERPPAHGRTTHLHRRGEYLQPAEAVEPGAIAAVLPFDPELPRNRLGLARWIASPQNPLTARVAVNRAWQAFFGQGIVRTLGDFGYQGEPPSHPELLDWLAVDFVREGWSMKRLHRRIVTSATYRQRSSAEPTLRGRDPDNRLLARGPRGRLEAEIVRDGLLRGSGLLALAMGGPGVYPPQPAGVTEVAYGNPAWPTSAGDQRYRRSIYTYQKRTAPFALFATFDAPSGESCVARRDAANTPLQALTLLNDVLLVDCARALGAALARTGGDDATRIDRAFVQMLTRHATPDEIAVLTGFLARQRERLGAGELDAAAIAGPATEGGGDRTEAAAWTLLARVLCNCDEVVTKR
ncbi:MAG: PSD1 and planctomycete cytochrome C domain-containing protein [Planctomycetota bacterium]